MPKSAKLALAKRRQMIKSIRRIAGQGEEVKHVGVNAVSAAFNSTISASTECYPLLPAVTEGTDGHQRIGDKIRPKYLIVKGQIQYNTTDPGFENYIPPSTIRVMLLTQKNLKVSTDISGRADVSHLLKDNIATDAARYYNGTMFDNLAPINKDLFNVYMDRKFKLKPQIAKQMGNNNTVTYAGTQATVTFYKKIRCPKTLYFDDGNTNTPNNFAPFFCMGGVCDDNSGAFTVGTPYYAVVQSILYFTDA